MMDGDILKIILQAGSASAALFALWLYHKSVTQMLTLTTSQRADIEKLISACLALADDRETLRSLLLRALECRNCNITAYDATREAANNGQNRPTA